MIIHDIVKNAHPVHLNQLVGHEIALHYVFKPCMHASATWQYVPKTCICQEMQYSNSYNIYIILYHL